VVFNVYELYHFASDVLAHGCILDEMSAFPFENNMTRIKRHLRSPNNEIQQLFNRIHEANMVPRSNDYESDGSDGKRSYTLINLQNYGPLFSKMNNIGTSTSDSKCQTFN